MGRNKVKIISNKVSEIISYYLWNENGEWMLADNSSPLSRREYTDISFIENCGKIISVIDEIYNIGNRGIDIIFEGSDAEYSAICKVLKNNDTNSIVLCENKEKVFYEKESKSPPKTFKEKNNQAYQKDLKDGEKNRKVLVDSLERAFGQDFSGADIICEHQKSKIVVAGKIGTGKSLLIEAFCRINNIEYLKTKYEEYTLYKSEDGNTILYELNGIGWGKGCIETHEEVVDKIASDDMTVYLYCLATSKIEESEIKIILGVQDKYPEAKVLIVLTAYIEDDAPLVAEQISKQMNGLKVIPVLAEDRRTRQGIIPSFGLDVVSRYLYGGR